jgi:uncharacterized protein YndB with AHSA1/START domain
MTQDTDYADYGELDLAGDQIKVRFARRLAHPPAKVWRALTEDQHLAAWFPTTIDGERAAGAKLSFAFREMEIPPMEGQMLAFDPPAVLEMVWGDETLRFELAADGAGTLLRFTASFAELGKVARDAAGWHSSLDLLACEVSGQPSSSGADEVWRRVHPVYVQRFGPEASTIGPPQEWEDAHRG